MYEFLSFWNIIYTVIIIYSPIQWYRGFYGSVYSRASSISNNCRRHIFNNHGTIGSDYVDTWYVKLLNIAHYYLTFDLSFLNAIQNLISVNTDSYCIMGIELNNSNHDVDNIHGALLYNLKLHTHICHKIYFY